MKSSLPAKLTALVIWLFAVVLGVIAFYRPLKYRILESDLVSRDTPKRMKAAKRIAADGAHAVPFLRAALKSGKHARVLGALVVADELPGEMWRNLLPQLGEVLDGPLSESTDAAAAFLEDKSFMWQAHFSGKPVRLCNMYCYILANSKGHWSKTSAAVDLGHIGDRRAAARLYAEMIKQNDEDLEYACALALAKLGDTRSISPLLELVGLTRIWEQNTAARDVMAAIGKMGASALPAVTGVLKNGSDPEARYFATLALWEIMNPDTLRILIGMFGEDDSPRLLGDIKLITSAMPGDFPRCDPKADRKTRKKQAENMIEWLSKNPDRLPWPGGTHNKKRPPVIAGGRN